MTQSHSCHSLACDLEQLFSLSVMHFCYVENEDNGSYSIGLLQEYINLFRVHDFV
jgi:hypothetical protein